MLRRASSSTTPVLRAVRPKRGPDRLTLFVNGGGWMTPWADATPAETATHMTATNA